MGVTHEVGAGNDGHGGVIMETDVADDGGSAAVGLFYENQYQQ